MASVIKTPRSFYCQTTNKENEPEVEKIPEDQVENFSASGSIPEETDPALEDKIEQTEKVVGPSSSREFQAETKKLLDIVAKSLYTDKEVSFFNFIFFYFIFLIKIFFFLDFSS